MAWAVDDSGSRSNRVVWAWAGLVALAVVSGGGVAAWLYQVRRFQLVCEHLESGMSYRQATDQLSATPAFEAERRSTTWPDVAYATWRTWHGHSCSLTLDPRAEVVVHSDFNGHQRPPWLPEAVWRPLCDLLF